MNVPTITDVQLLGLEHDLQGAEKAAEIKKKIIGFRNTRWKKTSV